MSPTQRTMAAQRKLNRAVGIVERFEHNRRVGIRSDLFGLFDLIAMSPRDGIIGVQCCGADYAAHFRKMTVQNGRYAAMWIESGGKIELWAWRKVKMFRGSKRDVVKPRIKIITLSDIQTKYVFELDRVS